MDRINLISNITIDYIKQNLSKEYEVYCPAGYDNWISEILNYKGELYEKSLASFFILFGDSFWKAGFANESLRTTIIDESISAIETYVIKVNHPVFVSNVEIAFEYAAESFGKQSHIADFEEYWAKNLYKLCSEHENVILMDISNISRRMGYDRFYSAKMWYMGGMPFSLDAISVISDEIRQCIFTTQSSRKKCLVMDLDNTLWGGVVAEEDIELSEHGKGSVYRDFQRQILRIKDSGIILAIISKNNIEDVEPVISSNPNMMIHFDDIAAYRINWKDKWENIKEVADELNIGLESMVFIDDNPVEQSGMKHFCPEVEVPEFPPKIEDLPQFGYLLWKKYFYTFSVLEEDKNKTRMYIEEKSRKELSKNVSSLSDYIKNLQIEIDMHKMRSAEIKRVSELCNKTNQFNLTTRRYSETDIREFAINERYDVFSVFAKDRFGDNGLIAVVICQRMKLEVVIDSFFMSCRVMGRKIENAIISNLIRYYNKEGMDKLIGEYIKTKKNSPVEKLYPELGFEDLSKNRWFISLNSVMELEVQDYFKNVEFEV